MDCPIRERLNRLTDAANKDAASLQTIKGWRVTVALTCDEKTYEIVLNGNSASLPEVLSGNPDISFILSAKTLDELMAGSVTPLGAKLRGDIRSSGSIMSILRFASLLSAAVKSMAKSKGSPSAVGGVS